MQSMTSISSAVKSNYSVMAFLSIRLLWVAHIKNKPDKTNQTSHHTHWAGEEPGLSIPFPLPSSVRLRSNLGTHQEF